MTIRFADILSRKISSQIASINQDFVPRKRRPLWESLLSIFLSVLVFCIVVSLFIKETIIFAGISFIVVSSLGVYVIIVLQRNRDLMLAPEFQNAIFSSALSQSNEFCLIVRNDSTIVYMDRSFQEMFPSFYKESRRAVDVLLEHGQVSREERKMVFNAIEKRARSKVVFDMVDSKKQPHRIIMSIEPIVRPKGFMLLRGREFVEKRVLGPQIISEGKSPIFNKTSLNMFSYVMDSMDIGSYMIDLFGNITYANLTLEQWLDFDENEIIDRALPLKDIILQNNLDIFLNDMKSFDGEVTLQRKAGGYIKAILNQKAMYDEQGMVIGYTALLHRVKDKEPNNNFKNYKANLW